MKGILSGVIYGIVLSFLSSLLFMLVGQVYAGGVTSFWGESWLYFSTFVPFVVTFAILGFYFSKNKPASNKRLWLISLVTAFLVTLYSGTIGAIFGEYMARGGMETINIDGTLLWGTIYAFVLLPVTVPFARVLIQIYLFLSKRV